MPEGPENLRRLFQELTSQLASAGIDSPRQDAAQLLTRILNISLATLYAKPDLVIPAAQVEQLRLLGRQRAARVPLAYVLEQADFFGRSFKVGPGVLIPRPDSECLVETALRLIEPGWSPVRILDLCAGSGCIGISLACQLREQARDCALTLTEVDTAAAAYARENLERFGLTRVSRLVMTDLFPPPAGNAANSAVRYHLIVANPPYIPTDDIGSLMPEVSVHEPRLALDGGADGLDFYRRIIAAAPQYLQAGGWLLFEQGYNQAETVGQLFQAAGCFAPLVSERDYGGNPRVTGGRYQPVSRG